MSTTGDFPTPGRQSEEALTPPAVLPHGAGPRGTGGPHFAAWTAQAANAPSSSLYPLLDVSLVTYNSAKWLPMFLRSLLAQGYPCDRIRVLAVDNGSTDDSWTLLEDFARQQGAKFAEVAHSREPNRGFGAGHNCNLHRSAADYFLVTNVDLEFEHDTLLQLVSAALTSPAEVACWECRQKPYEHAKYYNPLTLETRWSSSACVLLRTAAMRAVGGYDEKLFMYGEDVDLSYRLRDRGYQLRYTPKAVCWHYCYTSSGPRPLQYLGISLANLLLRLRFGTTLDRLRIPFVYLSRWWLVFFHPQFASGLLAMIPKFIVGAPHFMLSRRKSTVKFPFRGIDYDLTRDDGLYRQPKVSRTEWPLVSVIIRTYAGRLGYLREAVRSVLNQTYPNIELIVVEDGVTRFAQDFLRECQQSSRVTIGYCSIPKAGRCRAGNEGLAWAQGEYIGFLDDDDFFFADHLETLINELLEKPRYAAAYSTAWEVATQVESLDPLRYREIMHQMIHRQPFNRPLLWQRNYIPIQSVVFHRSLYERHGGFAEDLELLEDWNLWTRFSLADDFLFVDKTTSGYRVPARTDEQVRRSKRFQDYYPIAKRKQAAMRVELDLQSFAQMCQELQQWNLPPASLPQRAWRYLRTRGVRATLVRAVREVFHRLRIE